RTAPRTSLPQARRSPGSPPRARGAPAPGESSSRDSLHQLYLYLLAGFHRAALVLEHDEAVRLRHRAQHAGALLTRDPRLPLVAVPVELSTQIFGASGHLS